MNQDAMDYVLLARIAKFRRVQWGDRAGADSASAIATRLRERMVREYGRRSVAAAIRKAGAEVRTIADL